MDAQLWFCKGAVGSFEPIQQGEPAQTGGSVLLPYSKKYCKKRVNSISYHLPASNLPTDAFKAVLLRFC